MFGCYRRTEAADPGTYVAAVALVLTHYPVVVVDAITDPFNGLPARKNERGYSGLPDVADVKQACEDEAARVVRMANYRAMGKTEFKRLPRPPAQPGEWANVLVTNTDHRYARMVELTRKMDVRLWKMDEEGRGIWVGLSLIEDKPAELKRFRQFTDAELREMYPPRTANDSEQSHVKPETETTVLGAG